MARDRHKKLYAHSGDLENKAVAGARDSNAMPIVPNRAVRREMESRRAHVFAKINWHAHVVPLIQRRGGAFVEQFTGVDKPYLEWRDEEGRTDAALANAGLADPAPREIWTDSIAVRFPVKPLSRTAVVPVPGRFRRLAQFAASLEFAERASGGVVVRLYLPRSELLEPKRRQYDIRSTTDPRRISKAYVDRRLRDLYEIQSAWSTESARPFARWWLLKKLECMDRATHLGGIVPWWLLVLAEPLRRAFRAVVALARSVGHSPML